jgi:hypothetical protein
MSISLLEIHKYLAGFICLCIYATIFDDERHFFTETAIVMKQEYDNANPASVGDLLM